MDYYDANSFNLDICTFADFNDFMRHSSIYMEECLIKSIWHSSYNYCAMSSQL